MYICQQVNGTTMVWLVKRLGLACTSQIKHRVMIGRTVFEDLINKDKDTLETLQNEKQRNSFARIREIFRETALKRDKLKKDESSNSVAIE